MKKLSLAIYSAVSVFLASVPGIALAGVFTPGDFNFDNVTPPRDLNITSVIVRVADWLFGIAFALAVLFLIVGGVRYVISAGREDDIEQAKKTIFNAIIGIVVILLALVIVKTLGTFLN